jgi:hypothetical protein
VEDCLKKAINKVLAPEQVTERNDLTDLKNHLVEDCLKKAINKVLAPEQVTERNDLTDLKNPW